MSEAEWKEDILSEEIILDVDEEVVPISPDRVLPGKYPCLVVEGVLLEVELDYLRRRPYAEATAIPLFVFMEGEYYELCSCDLTMDSLLNLRGLGYGLRLMLSESEEHVLDSPDLYLNFMRL